MTTVPTPAEIAHRSERAWRIGETPWLPGSSPSPRARVIIDNDFSGDPDDLYHLVHQLLSPSTEVRLVIGSHLRDSDPFDAGPDTADHAVLVAQDVFARMGLRSTELIVAGANAPLRDRVTPQPSAAAEAIIAEALRADERPLYYLAGGGLTDLASAHLIEPRIADRLQVIWIGGGEHAGHAAPPPDAMPIEYNLLIDVLAARVVFTDSALPIWQIPRNVYRQCLVSDAELRQRVFSTGPLGEYLYREVAEVVARATGEGRGPAETYALGDSPLALLTALQSLFEADPSSSRYETIPTPEIDDRGSYRSRPDARPMRVYTWVDTRLMFEDFFWKLHEFSRWHDGARDA